jgi:hypothetical protein
MFNVCSKVTIAFVPDALQLLMLFIRTKDVFGTKPVPFNRILL